MGNLFSLKGKIALVTGAGGYLGQIIAMGLAESGAIVYLNGRSEQKIKKLQGQIIEAGFEARAATFDITKREEIEVFFSQFEEESLDILVNNAYQGGAGTIETANQEDYSSSYEIALISVHNLIQQSLPYLRRAVALKNDASVINIASMYGTVSPDLRVYDVKESANPPFYGAAKAALIQWTKYAACEFANEAIRFNSISPGPFPSTLTAKKLVSGIIKKVPMNRIGQPHELIGPVVFLASPSASFVTGANLAVDGGWTSW